MFNKLAVVGAGAIGCVIGGHLSQSGVDITLIDMWPEHVDKMKHDGLKATTVEGEFQARVRAMHLGEVCNLKEPFDLVFLCVKSYDTEWSVKFIEPYLKPTGVVVSAQNGMNDESIASLLGFSRVIGCVVTLGAGLYEPGHVVRTTSVDRPAFALGELNGLATARVQELARLMTPAGKTRVTTNLWGERWAKLATNSMANSVAGLTGLGSADLRLRQETVIVSIKIATEAVKVGHALGIEVQPVSGIPAELYEHAADGKSIDEIKARLAEGAEALREGKPSLLQDVLKGRRTEVDYLNGYVARRGREVGIPTPVNEAITDLIHRVERGELTPDVANIKYLEPYL